MHVEVKAMPPEQRPLLHNLMQKYLYDFSEYDRDDVDEEGLYFYKYTDLYWVEPERYPFLIRAAGKIAGFALVRRSSGFDEAPFHSMAEFFVMRKYRGQGVGRAAAVQLFDLFPGRWHVAQEPRNQPSQIFWQQVVGDYSGGRYEQTKGEDDEPQQIFATPGTGSD
ncbi:MAG: GNAT family N-acetyltransferase [Candidatus Latescibacteria bacterium]|nr:GNAT family N-acetyltransferase [Candidatus Latescibacterota bacterium]